MTTTLATLSNDHLHRSAPSIFAPTPWHRMSDRYRFVPTIEVVDLLRDRGFQPVRAQQSRSRIEGKAAFTRHMVRFRHDSLLDSPRVGEEIPELVLVNSHDGTSSYQLMAGIFRLVCSNGLVVQSADFGSISIRHNGSRDLFAQVREATARIMEGVPDMMGRIEAWKQIILPRSRQIELAREAWHLKPNEAIKPVWLLTARRPEDATNEDASRSLWLTLNSVQEALIAGGVRGTNSRGRRIQTRPVKAVAKDIEINRKLWAMAEKYAEN